MPSNLTSSRRFGNRWVNNASAVRHSSSVTFVGCGSVCERVIVLKSAKTDLELHCLAAKQVPE